MPVSSISMGALVAVTLLALTPGSTTAAQRPSRMLTLAAGPSGGELPSVAGEGTTGLVLGLRFGQPVATAVIIEASLNTYVHGGESDVLPELGVHLEAPIAHLRPYVGGGVGYALLQGSSPFALHLVGGLRWLPREAWDLRVELRPRFLAEGWYLIDLTGGLSWRIP